MGGGSKYQIGSQRSEARGRKSEIGNPTPDVRRLARTIVYNRVAYPKWCRCLCSYGPALLPGLALLAGLALDKFIGLVHRLPLAERDADRRMLTVAILLTALLALGSLRQSKIKNPKSEIERLALWEQAGLWLQKNMPPESIVWSDAPSANGVLGYFSERRVVNAVSPDAPPDYCVALNTLAWKEQISQPWFQEHYRRVTTIANPYDSLAPLTIYRYRPSPFDAGPVVSVGARLGEGIELVSYSLDSTQLIPGEAQHLTLTWRALQPLPKALNARVRLYDSASRRVWAQVDDATPANIRTQLWPVGQPMTDHYTLEIPDDLPAGAYQIEVQMLHAENEVMPGTNIEHPLGDSVTLARLEAQPWISDTPLALRAAHPLTATFGEPTLAAGRAIQLTGYSASARVDRGAVLRVRLYWHALAAPSGSYHVFAHLLSADNRLVAQQDSAPVFETYPTDQWQAGQYILDEHLIPIDAATPPGRYWLKVGLYSPESGERLTVRDQAGREMPDQTRSVPLIQVDVE